MNTTTLLEKIPGLVIRLCPPPLIGWLTTPLLQALNDAMDEDDWLFAENRWIELVLADWQLRLVIVARRKQWHILPPVQANTSQVGHIVISGTVPSFCRLLSEDIDAESLFFQRALSLRGDTETGYWFKALLDRIDRQSLPHWLQHMARFPGKIMSLRHST